jgi:hypothetical protein
MFSFLSQCVDTVIENVTFFLQILVLKCTVCHHQFLEISEIFAMDLHIRKSEDSIFHGGNSVYRLMTALLFSFYLH